MNYYMKQKVFSWRDRFWIYDENGREVYYVEGEIFSFGKKLHLYDPSGNELVYIEEKLFSFKPRYALYRFGRQIAEVIKEFTFFRQRYTVEGLGWSVSGSFWAHEYEVYGADGRALAAVSREWFSLGDAYMIHVEDGIDEINALATVLVIDACLEASQNN